MLVSHKWVKQISVEGAIVGNIMQHVFFYGLLDGSLGIATIYASNEFKKRCELQEDMFFNLPIDYKWIVIGNFNGKHYEKSCPLKPRNL